MGNAKSYCQTIKSNNINGKVLQYCYIDELRNVVGMNFGDWELFKMALIAMRISKYTASANKSLEKENYDFIEDKKADMKQTSNHRESVIKQVAMEEEAVSGLLTFINEDAREDYEEDEEEVVRTNSQEVECIYYSNVGQSVHDINSLSSSTNHIDTGRRSGRPPIPKLVVNGEEVVSEKEVAIGPHVWIGHSPSSSFLNRERSQSECPDIQELEEVGPKGAQSFLNKSMTKLFESKNKKDKRKSHPEFYLEPSHSLSGFELDEIK